MTRTKGEKLEVERVEEAPGGYQIVGGLRWDWMVAGGRYRPLPAALPTLPLAA